MPNPQGATWGKMVWNRLIKKVVTNSCNSLVV